MSVSISVVVERSIGEIVERSALLASWLDSLLELINRQAGDVVTILTAHLCKLGDRAAWRAGSSPSPPTVVRVSACILGRVIASKVIVSIGRE